MAGVMLPKPPNRLIGTQVASPLAQVTPSVDCSAFSRFARFVYPWRSSTRFVSPYCSETS